MCQAGQCIQCDTLCIVCVQIFFYLGTFFCHPYSVYGDRHKLAGRAQDAQNDAMKMKQEYEDALKGAKQESVQIVENARSAAKNEYDRIVAEAGEKAGSIRLSGTAGFVCWQIGEGTQNDALLLGARLAWESRHAGLYVEYGQYKGRENDWAASYGIDSGDWPQSIKSRLDLHFGDFSPFIYVQYGFRDWPFTQFRLGLTWSFDLLGHFSAGASR